MKWSLSISSLRCNCVLVQEQGAAGDVMKVFVHIQTLWCRSSLWIVVSFLLLDTFHQLRFFFLFFFPSLECFNDTSFYWCVFSHCATPLCVAPGHFEPCPLWFLAGKWMSAARSKTAFGPTPRALWEVSAQHTEALCHLTVAEDVRRSLAVTRSACRRNCKRHLKESSLLSGFRSLQEISLQRRSRYSVSASPLAARC